MINICWMKKNNQQPDTELHAPQDLFGLFIS